MSLTSETEEVYVACSRGPRTLPWGTQTDVLSDWKLLHLLEHICFFFWKEGPSSRPANKERLPASGVAWERELKFASVAGWGPRWVLAGRNNEAPWVVTSNYDQTVLDRVNVCIDRYWEVMGGLSTGATFDSYQCSNLTSLNLGFKITLSD